MSPSRPGPEAPRFQALVEKASDLISTLDRDGRMMYQSPPLKRLLGYDPEELEGELVFDYIHPSEVSDMRARWEELVSHPGRTLHVQPFRFRHSDGSWRVWEATLTNHLEDPVLEAVVANAREVTERWEADRQLREQAALLDQARDAIIVRDMDHVVTFWNAAAERLYGWTAEEAIGQPKHELIYRDATEFWNATRHVLDAGEWAGELEHVRKDGTPLIVQGRWTLIRDETGAPDRIFSVNADVTRKVARKQRIRFQAELLAAVGQAVMATDMEGRITYWNRTAQELYGWSAEEALGRNILEVTPSHRSRGQAQAIMDAMRQGESWTGEFEVQRKDGSTFPARVTNSPILDDEGHQVGIIGVSSDLTESRALEKQLREAQKMEAVGRLAGGIAHDFNNLLTVIHSQAELSLMELPDASSLEEDLGVIRDAAGRAGELTGQLLAFSRKQILRPRIVRVNDVVHEMRSLLRRTIRQDIRIEVDLTDGLPPVRVDPAQLEQVILNLAVNARDAMPEGGELEISTRLAPPAGPDGEGPSELGAGPVVELRVSDTGIGMDAATRERIFEPFFTTKGQTGGSGLGLATSYGIIRQSGGVIRVDSEPGEGSTFVIRFPAADGVVEEISRPEAGNGSGAKLSGIALVVEDEAGVRRVTRKTLEKAGLEVRTAEDAAAAELMLRGGAGDFDFVLTDIVLIEGSGRQIIDLVRRDYPALPVIAMSGYNEGSPGHPEGLPEDIPFIQKPFAPSDLLRTVRETLGAA